MKTITIFSIIFFVCAAMFAQTDMKSNLTEDEINDLTSKLAMKLLLNDSQKSAVSGLLKTYGSELQKITAGSGEIRYKDKQELISSINSQVESLLDSKQKMKYDVLKKDWWSSINSEEND
jgi:signal recognition particle GTPase